MVVFHLLLFCLDPEDRQYLKKCVLREVELFLKITKVTKTKKKPLTCKNKIKQKIIKVEHMLIPF